MDQFLLDLGLALGADPTRPEVNPWHGDPWQGDSHDGDFRNGEPFGELGLFTHWHDHNEDWWGYGQGIWWNGHDANWWHDHANSWWWGDDSSSHWPWHGGQNPGLDVEGASDAVNGHEHHQPSSSSLGLVVLSTPAAHTSQIEDIHWLSEDAEALLHRIVIRGQLTAAEGAALSHDNLDALNELVYRGYVVKSGTVWMPTNATWLALGLADPPTITSVSNSRPTLSTATITLTGTGDATDTITIWDGAIMLGTGAIVDANGRWTITVTLTSVGSHDLTATQTVNQLPQAGTLTSARSCDVDVDVYPDAARILSVSTPGPTTTSTPVTVTGSGMAGYTINLYDASRWIASVVIGAGGTWSLTVSLWVGGHSLAATQTSPTVPGGRFTSSPSSSASVTVYAPPSAPALSSIGTGTVTLGASVSGRGVAGGLVELYESGVLVGSDVADAWGNWSATLAVLSLGRHTLVTRQQDARSGFWSGFGSSFVVTVNPNAPLITFASTPGPASPSAMVTVSGTGVAGYTVKVYDGGALKATVLVAADGTWTATFSLGTGGHSLTATQTSLPVGGTTFTSAASASMSVPVYAPPAAPTAGSAPANVYAGSAFSVSGRGAAGATVRIYDAGVEIGSAIADGWGYWTVSLSLVTTGAHALSMRQQAVDSGFISAATSFVVTAYANYGPPSITSVSTPAQANRTASVTVGGTGVAGQTITLYDGSGAIKTVVVAANGTWSTTVSLAVGAHTLTATQSPAAGLESAPSAGRIVTVVRG
jgi:hypothetical protein